MFHGTRKRLPLVATGLAIALSCIPLQGEDKSPADPSSRNTSKSSTNVTLSGKVVDLHQYMTGETRSPIEHISPTDRNKPTDPSNPDRNKANDSSSSSKTNDGIKSGDRDKNSSMNKSEIMGLETSTGLVLLCFKDAPGVYATPRADDQPRTTTPTPTPSAEPRGPKATAPDQATDLLPRSNERQDCSHWLDKQVQVTGSMYEKNGIKFFVVTKIGAQDNSKPRGDTAPDSTPNSK